MQYPKVPNETSDPLARFTFRIGMLLMIGAEIVVITKSTEAARRRKVPTWWKIPVLAILKLVGCICLVGGVDGGEEDVKGDGELVGVERRLMRRREKKAVVERANRPGFMSSCLSSLPARIIATTHHMLFFLHFPQATNQGRRGMCFAPRLRLIRHFQAMFLWVSTSCAGRLQVWLGPGWQLVLT